MELETGKMKERREEEGYVKTSSQPVPRMPPQDLVICKEEVKGKKARP